MRTFMICATLVALAALPAGAAMSPQDQTFIVAAAQGGRAEVQAARLALQKTSDPAVVDFAHRMIDDHSMANRELASIARRVGAPLPAGIDRMDAMAASELQGLTGRSFAVAYLRAQRAAHKRTIALFLRESGTGSNPAVVAFAKRTLPTLREHDAMVNSDLARVASR